MMTVTLPDQIERQVTKNARDQDTTLSELIQKAIIDEKCPDEIILMKHVQPEIEWVFTLYSLRVVHVSASDNFIHP